MSNSNSPTSVVARVSSPVVRAARLGKKATHQFVDSVRAARIARASAPLMENFKREIPLAKARSDEAADFFFLYNGDHFQEHAERLARDPESESDKPEVWIENNRLLFADLSAVLFHIRLKKEYQARLAQCGNHDLAKEFEEEISALEAKIYEYVMTFEFNDYPLAGYIQQHHLE